MTRGDDRTDEVIALEQARAAALPQVNGVREHARQREEDAGSGASAGQARAAEATVTFVIREPVASPRRRTPPFDPASLPIEEGDGPRQRFVPHNGGIDEAEVEIIGPDTTKGAAAPADRPKGPLRRFLKTLIGS